MILELSLYSITLFATAAIMGFLTLYVWKRRSVPGGTYFALLMAASAEWAFMGALEYTAVDMSTEILFARLTYMGAVAILPLWLLFTIDYSSPGRKISWKLNALLWTLPVIVVALVFTNDYHGLIWSSIVQVNTETGYALIYNKGIGFWAIVLYSIAVVVPGLALLIRKAIGGSENSKYLTVAVLLGTVFIELSSIASELGQYALGGIDITPFAFAIMGLVVSWGIYRHHIFELMPVATEKLVENMVDGILVLNKHGEIVKINDTARQMLGITGTVVGQKVEKAMAIWPRLAEHIEDPLRRSFEITIGQRWIEASASSLPDKKRLRLGTLIVLRDITERKLSEESMMRSQYDLLKAEQLAHVGYFELNIEKFEAHVSEGCARIYGFPPGTDTVSFQKFMGTIHPEDAKRVGEEIRANIEQGTGRPIEYRILRPDGSVRYIYSESEVRIKDERGFPVRQFGIVQDITERKQAEESLRKSEFYRIKAERLAHLGYYDWDLKTFEAHVSEGCARIYGYPASTRALSYGQIKELIHPEDVAYVDRQLSSPQYEGQTRIMEFRIVLPDGSIRHLYSESEAMIRDPTGAPIRQFGIVQDITERKRAEEALQVSEARYKTMVETAGEGICILDKEDRVVFINKKVSDLTGFTPEEAYGQSAYGFIGSEYHEALRKNLAAKRLGVSEQYDYRLNCKDGSSVWVIASASALYDEKGEFMATLAMLTDITDRKRADEQLKVSLKEKEALLKEVHHRVKNNLQIITSLLNLQSSGMEDPKYTDMIRDSQNRIKSMALVHEHLYKSRDLSNIDIAEYLTSLITNISRSYSQASGRATLRTDIENINVDIDRAVPIGIIVTELVSNAYKYAFPEGRKGEIGVELHRDAEKIVLTIRDNGVGLPEDFEIGKTGTLGLQLVEMLTQQIDGELEIEKGERTVFRIISGR
ncbi:histidine kinase N-terminal 7TM domain-containing protein [Methanocella sp. MCL-LM]|uniref:histidine kinase N-terminal 7TM domain-containing protein n=1 Tax=Methanocella sp. MCL-LM TaxID=3412035 RepID=UPI003C7640D9